MIIREAIVLAGGLGTRLKKALPETPKCLAPVNGKPFIQYVIAHLQQIGIQCFVFALGYKADVMIAALNELNLENNFIFSVEDEPLGTGGAIWNATKMCTDDNVLIVNGDTLFDTEIDEATTIHKKQHAWCTLMLKPMDNCSRYGAVAVNDQSQVIAFGEKNNNAAGLINAGMYLLNIPGFNSNSWPRSFSFEKEFLQPQVASKNIYAAISDAYFIDIGIPHDYEKAIVELPLAGS